MQWWAARTHLLRDLSGKSHHLVAWLLHGNDLSRLPTQAQARLREADRDIILRSREWCCWTEQVQEDVEKKHQAQQVRCCRDVREQNDVVVRTLQ